MTRGEPRAARINELVGTAQSQTVTTSASTPGLDQSCKIVGITRHDAVRVAGEQRDMTVNHVVSSGDRK